MAISSVVMVRLCGNVATVDTSSRRPLRQRFAHRANTNKDSLSLWRITIRGSYRRDSNHSAKGGCFYMPNNFSVSDINCSYFARASVLIVRVSPTERGKTLYSGYSTHTGRGVV